MKNIIKSDAELVWANFTQKAQKIDDVEFLTTNNTNLKELLKVNYNDVLSQAITVAINEGKTTTNKLDYVKLKLNRAIVRLNAEGVVALDSEVTYTKRDVLKSFPQLNQNAVLTPTNQTLNKLRVSVIQKHVNAYNQYASQNGKKEIQNLNQLRNFLVNGLKIDKQNASVLTRLYDQVNTASVIWNIKN